MRASTLSLAAGALLLTSACTGPTGLAGGGEGLDPTSIPEGVREDYRVFAHRCSKCHSLARAFNSGIDDDAFWARYVARMRRQPASGISQADEVVILRFLHYYSEEQRRTKAAAQGADSAAPPPPAAVTPAPTAAAIAPPPAAAAIAPLPSAAPIAPAPTAAPVAPPPTSTAVQAPGKDGR